MDSITETINRANQRGGRMLSIVDLVDRDTLTVEHASFLADRVNGGSSWLVGAVPGGAGKTAVMCAVMGLLPCQEKVYVTSAGTGWETASEGDCVVSYELSPGGYDAYIWGTQLQQFVGLGSRGVRIVSNLHADTLDEAREQVVVENGCTEDAFLSFDMFIPIELSGGVVSRNRRVTRIMVCERGEWREADTSGFKSSTAGFIEDCLRDGVKTVEEVRARWTGLPD